MRKGPAGVALDISPSLAALAAPDCALPNRPSLLPAASASSPAHGAPVSAESVRSARPDVSRATHGMNGVAVAEGWRAEKGAVAGDGSSRTDTGARGAGSGGMAEVEGGAGDADVRRAALDPATSASGGSGRSMRHLGSSKSVAISRGPSMTDEENDDGEGDGLLSVRRGQGPPSLSFRDDDDGNLDSARSDARGSSGRSSGSSGRSSPVTAGATTPRRHTGVGPALQHRPLPPSMSMSRARMRLAGMRLDMGVLPMGPAGVLLPGQAATDADPPHMPAPSALGRGGGAAALGADGLSAIGEGGGFGGEGGVGEEEEEEEPMDVRDRKEKFLFFERQCSRVMEHLYVGSDAVARDRDILRQSGISHVVNCVGFVCPEYFPHDITYKTLWLQDNTSEDIQCVLYDVFDFMNQVKQANGRCYVHCCQGVSRSTSLVIAYLMWSQQVEFEGAFRTVKAIRGVASPNMGFACQLLQWQKRVLAPPPPTPTLPPDASTELHAPAVHAGAIESQGTKGDDGERGVQGGGMGGRQVESVRVYRMAPHSPYDPLHLVPKMANDVSVASLDPRGAFLVQVGSSLYVWCGLACRPPMRQQAEHAAGQIVRYERLPLPPTHIEQGQEPQGFRAALSARRLVRGGSGEWGVCLSVLEREGLTYLGQDAHQVADQGDLRASAAMLRAGGDRGAADRDRRVDNSAGDAGSLNGSGRGEWVVEEREEYSFDYECFNKGLDGGTPVTVGAVSSPPAKVLPHQRRGWLEASLPLNPTYRLPWDRTRPPLPSPVAAAGSSEGAVVASTSSALARLTMDDSEPPTQHKGRPEDEAKGGEQGRVPRKPVFALLPLHAHTSLPSPSSFSPRSLGFFPPSGSGAYGSALSKFAKPKEHRLKDQSPAPTTGPEGLVPTTTATATGSSSSSNNSSNGSGSGNGARVVRRIQASGLGSSGGGVRRGLPPLTPRNKGGSKGQQAQGWADSGDGGAEEDEALDLGVVQLLPGPGVTAGSSSRGMGQEQEGGGEEEDMESGAGPVWLPSPRRGKPKLAAAWEDDEPQGGGEEEDGEEESLRGTGSVVGGLGERRGIAARGKAPKLPPRHTAPLSDPPTAASTAASSNAAALPPAPRFTSHLMGRRESGEGGDGWRGEWGGGGVDEAESSGMDAFGVPLTPRRRLPPRSAFGRGFRATGGEGAGDGLEKGDLDEDGGMRSKKKGGIRKEKEWPQSDEGGVLSVGEYGGEGGVGMDAMDVEEPMGAAMALPTPRRLGPQIKKIF